ncbi:hypothetical protein ACFXNW_15455 [Nocardia sp. NPDC059180]|uniref:hypothetical protein n=1 Tax=Nocardia sp. NPDC059180 TaxID=3346761 RepID=UPI00367793EB
MTDQHPPLRASGISRLLALVVLLGGIVAMHAGVFSFGHAGAHAHGGTAAAAVATDHGRGGVGVVGGSAHGEAPHATATTALEVASTSDGSHEQDCGTGGCGAQGGMHGCVFILSMLGLVIGLVLLFRLAFQPLDGTESIGRRRPARRERPPPWTVPSLSELSILRV